MPEIPDGAKTPTDHLPTAAQLDEAEKESEELLADLPSVVRPPHRLRLRQRNKALDLMLNLTSVRELMSNEVDYSDVSTDDLILQAKERGLDANVTPAPAGESLTVGELKTALAEAGQPDDGVKAELVERYDEWQRRAAIIELLHEDDDTIDPEKDRESLKMLFDTAADIDEWVESDLVEEKDRPVYSEWAEGKGYLVFFALLSRYAKFSGE